MANRWEVQNLTTTDKITELYVATLGRAPDKGGLAYWVNEVTSGNQTIAQAAASFFSQPEIQAKYPPSITNTSFVIGVYSNALGRAPDTAGLNFWVGELDAGRVTRPDFILAFLQGAYDDPTATPPSFDASLLTNQHIAAEFFAGVDSNGNTVNPGAKDFPWTGTPAEQENFLQNAAAVIDPVTADFNTIAISNALTIAFQTGGGGNQSLQLTVSQDTITGTALNDVFIANVVQNELGLQVNTLGSGDILDGSTGADQLNAKITAGAFVGGGYSMPIQPETSDIEIVKLEAVSADINPVDNRDDNNFISYENTQVYVNAKDMVDVEQLWSSRSDADLIIQNLTTQGLTQLSDMTIGMEYTGNADSRWGESDYSVYFDQDYLTPEPTRTDPTVDLFAMNEDAYDETNGDLPLAGVFFRELTITVNGVRYDLTEFLGEDPLGNGEEISTYDDLLAAVDSAIVQLKAANPADAALQTLEADFGDQFFTDVDPVTLVRREGTAIRLTIDGLTNGVENELEVASTDLEVARAPAAVFANNNRIERVDNDPALEGDRLVINVALEKVGLAGDGGELIIGSMNKTSSNEWGAVNTTTDTTSGIEEFDVTVYGANDKSSSLSGLHSTNNNLRVVNVVTDAAQTGTFADLTIGNSNTSGGLGSVPSLNNQNALKDVQTFDASGLKGDLTLYAALTDEVTAKYFNLVDQAPDGPTVDNVNFEYTGGVGDDYFNIALDTSNAAFAGVVTREDFVMTATVAGGEGDDEIVLAMVNTGGLDDANPFNDEEFTDNWYDNQKLLQNVRIDGGAGNDTIWKPGSGDVIIDGGTGNDTVYADNTGAYPSGRKAIWAYNAADGFPGIRLDIDNLQSDVNNSYQLFKTDVVVNFKGFEAKAAIPSVNGVVTDLDINQALKLAINSDPVLSKLLIAEDGPGNTLVVSSLIDGNMEDDLEISLEAPVAADITAGDLNQLGIWYGAPLLNAAAAVALFNAQIALFDLKADYAETFARYGAVPGDPEYVGVESTHVSDNTITGGLGNDVLVLGTGFISNDTVAFEGFGNGIDTIVNFDTTVVVTTVTVPSVAVPESFTVTFGDLTPAVPLATITFDDSGAIALNNATTNLIPGEDVAFAFAEGYTAGAGTNWTADYIEGTNQVLITATVTNPGDVDPDVVAADFVYANATGTVTLSNYVDGADAFAAGNEAEFEIDFSGTVASVAGVLDLSALDGLGAGLGVQINYVVGDGPITFAAAVAAATYADWTVVDNLDGTVTFTANATGLADTALDTNAELEVIFDDGTNGINTVAAFTNGTAQVGTETVTTLEAMAGLDYLDFSAYNVESVFVGATLVAGVAALAGEEYVLMTETSTGIYNVQVFTEAGAGDTLVGTVGVLDFGATQDFVAENFII